MYLWKSSHGRKFFYNPPHCPRFINTYFVWHCPCSSLSQKDWNFSKRVLNVVDLYTGRKIDCVCKKFSCQVIHNRTVFICCRCGNSDHVSRCSRRRSLCSCCRYRNNFPVWIFRYRCPFRDCRPCTPSSVTVGNSPANKFTGSWLLVSISYIASYLLTFPGIIYQSQH